VVVSQGLVDMETMEGFHQQILFDESINGMRLRMNRNQTGQYSQSTDVFAVIVFSKNISQSITSLSIFGESLCSDLFEIN